MNDQRGKTEEPGVAVERQVMPPLAETDGILVCEENWTAVPSDAGQCPIHHGDACLHVFYSARYFNDRLEPERQRLLDAAERIAPNDTKAA